MTSRSSVVDVHPHQLDYRLLVEECLAGIYLIQDDRFLYVNPMLAEIFGYAQDELIAEHSVLDLVDPTDRERVQANLRRRQDGDVQALHYTFRGIRSDGSTLEAEVRGQRTSSAGRAAVIGTLLDVTDRSQERDRLRFLARAAELLDSSLDYEATLESLARLMIPFFADLCFIDIIEGDELRRLAAGPWPGEGEGFSLRTAVPPDGEADAGIELALTRGTGLLLETVPPETAERVAAQLPSRNSPEPLGIRSMIVVPLNARDEIIGAMTLATTVSGRRYQRHDLDFSREVARRAALAVDNARLYQEAQKAIQRRQEVLAVVSHDLRTPLNIITMSAALALEQERRRPGPMDTVHRAAKEMERLINDLLDASAIEAGGFSVRTAQHPLAESVRQCLEMMQPTANHRSIEMFYETPDDTTVAMLDEGRFAQAVCNLLNNALKFTPEGGTIRVGSGRRENVAYVYVRDSGPGIPRDQLDRVFDRFWQLEAGRVGGAGLGLAIVRGIAEAHGGSVRVESAPGEGSTFHLEIPVA